MKNDKENFNFEDLKVYQKALHFADFVYAITDNYLKQEKFTLTEQFRRAAVSIALNIAEGQGHSSTEFKRYLRIAKGSVRECVALITLSRLRKCIDLTEENTLRNYCVELAMILSGLIKSLS